MEPPPSSKIEEQFILYRNQLPVKSPKTEVTNLWSILKSCVGKDLSKVAMPVQFNEPLSFLQRITECLEYSKIINEICQDANSTAVERIEKVTAFAISNLSSNVNRLGKPFNPLFGETYELARNGWKILCEQVSHHPPISAFWAESENFTFTGWIYPKLKLGAKSVEVHPKGSVKLYLKKFNETYTWTHIYCSVHNIIVGKLWIEHHGNFEVHCNETGLTAQLHFKPSGWFNNELHRMEGFVVDGSKKKLRYLYGKWTDCLRSTDLESYEEWLKSNEFKFKLSTDVGAGAVGGGNDGAKKSPLISPSKSGKKIFQKFNSLSIRSFSTTTNTTEALIGTAGDGDSPDEDSMPKNDHLPVIEIPGSKTLWEPVPRPDYAYEYYHFTTFAMSLNQILPNTEVHPTDSRLRPDIRLLEEGDLEGASVEKQRLEDKQRKFMKGRPESSLVPIWFDKAPIQGSSESTAFEWKYKGGYWDKEIRKTAAAQLKSTNSIF